MEKESESETLVSDLPLHSDGEPLEMILPPNELRPHTYGMSAANIATNSEESRQFSVSESRLAEEGNDEECSIKSFSCVDYLEIMHDEMLNPNSNNASESDAQDESTDLVCKQPDCDFSTTDMDAYLKHEYEHVDGKQYECDVCHLKFNMFTSMRNHRMAHLSHRPYKCRLCSKEFFRKDILVEHLVKQHSKQRPYRCPFCPKHFKLRPQLKLHLSNEHSAAMLIKTCKLCGFKAVSPSAFRSHFAICYMKRSHHMPEANCNVSQILVSSQAGAIDLGTVSQNFSFVPSHYAPYAIVAGDATHSIPGPSDITQVVSLHTTSAGCSINDKSDHCAKNQHEVTTPPRISSLASSTTAISPTHPTNEEFLPRPITRVRSLVKSEPVEVRGDDSQSGNALPTSTMELSAANVETSYSNEVNCCEPSHDLSVKMKATCSSHPEVMESCRTHSEAHASHNRNCYTVPKVRHSDSARDVCRCCSSSSRHSHVHRCSRWNKRERVPDQSTEAESEMSHHEAHHTGKRLCHKATATEPEHQPQCDNGAYSVQSHMVPRVSRGDCCSDSKAHVMITNKVETSSHACPFCDIIFPDQTLYFLHRSLHSEAHPWKCNLCGKLFKDRYDFNSHILSQGHR